MIWVLVFRRCLCQRSTFQSLPAVFVSRLSFLKLEARLPGFPIALWVSRYVMFYHLDISNQQELGGSCFSFSVPVSNPMIWTALNWAVDPLQISICSTMHCNLTFVSWKSQWLVTCSMHKIWPVWWSSPIHQKGVQYTFWHVYIAPREAVHHSSKAVVSFSSYAFVLPLYVYNIHIYIYIYIYMLNISIYMQIPV